MWLIDGDRLEADLRKEGIIGDIILDNSPIKCYNNIIKTDIRGNGRISAESNISFNPSDV